MHLQHRFSGAQLGLAVTAVPAFVSNSKTATLTGPSGNSLSGNTDQSVTGFGDLYPRASLKWNENVNNFMLYGTGDIPVGLYSKDNIANIGTGHGAIDLGVVTPISIDRTGNEASRAVAGLTYNFTNPATNYRSGVDFHLTGPRHAFCRRKCFCRACRGCLPANWLRQRVW